MTGLIVLAAAGWAGFLFMLAVRRADKRHLAKRETTTVGERPDFARLAELADSDGMPDSARMYRTMDATWPAEKEPTVRPDPGVLHEPIPRIDREDVEDVHGVACYRNLNRPPNEPKYGRYRDYDLDHDNEHPLTSHCICHHACWHSCPDPDVGRRIFTVLPSRGVTPTPKLDPVPEDIDRMRHVRRRTGPPTWGMGEIVDHVGIHGTLAGGGPKD